MRLIARRITRITLYVVTAIVAIAINFFLPRLMPGNPALAVLGKAQSAESPQAAAALEVQYGVRTPTGMWGGTRSTGITYCTATWHLKDSRVRGGGSGQVAMTLGAGEGQELLQFLVGLEGIRSELIERADHVKARQTASPFAADVGPNALGDVTHSNRTRGVGATAVDRFVDRAIRADGAISVIGATAPRYPCS